MIPILAAAGLVSGIAGLIGQGAQRKKANQQLETLISQNPAYTANPLAGQRLGLARTLLNARMPGAIAAERNIYTNQGNQLAGVDRNATDASQALAAKAGIGASTNNAFQDLGQQEAADYQRRYNNFTGAQEGVINEGDKVYSDSVRRFGDEVSMRGAQQENKANTWRDITNFGSGLMNFGVAGGMQGLFGGGETNRQVINGLSQGGNQPRATSMSANTPNLNYNNSPAQTFGTIPFSPRIRRY